MRLCSSGVPLCLAKGISFKADLRVLVHGRRAAENNGEGYLNTPLPEQVVTNPADVILYAVGAESLLPDIPGIDHPHVLMATAVVPIPNREKRLSSWGRSGWR